MIKLMVLGQEKCTPCKIMNNQIIDRLDEISGVEYEYIDLNSLEDKDAFIQKFELSSTPTSIIVSGDWIVEKIDGYIDIDTLFSKINELKEKK